MRKSDKAYEVRKKEKKGREERTEEQYRKRGELGRRKTEGKRGGKDTKTRRT